MRLVFMLYAGRWWSSLLYAIMKYAIWGLTKLIQLPPNPQVLRRYNIYAPLVNRLTLLDASVYKTIKLTIPLVLFQFPDTALHLATMHCGNLIHNKNQSCGSLFYCMQIIQTQINLSDQRHFFSCCPDGKISTLASFNLSRL